MKYTLAKIFAGTMLGLVVIGIGIVICLPLPPEPVVIVHQGPFDVPNVGTGLMAVVGLALIIASRFFKGE